MTDWLVRVVLLAVVLAGILLAMVAEPPKTGLVVCDCRTGTCVAGTPTCTCLCAYEDEAAVTYGRRL